MWGSSFSLARRESEPFLTRLCALPAERIVYLPGNHDYHLLVQHIEGEQIEYLRRGETPPRRYRTQHIYPDSFLSSLLPSEARDRFTVYYPDYTRYIGGQRVLFHHGHHLATLRGGDLFASFPMFILKQLEGVGIPTLTREDLERGVSIFYEMMYAASLGDRTSTRLNAWWSRVQRWKRWWLWAVLGRVRERLRRSSSVHERGTPQMDIGRFRDATRWLIRLMALDDPTFTPPDILVFGHTHRSGIAQVPLDPSGQLHLVNAGCWFVEPTKRNTDHVNTLAILNSAHVGVYKLGDHGLEAREIVRFAPQESVPLWQ
jgi:UDP-2,3-diacylglucosamine pyrophosphatase LpxH